MCDMLWAMHDDISDCSSCIFQNFGTSNVDEFAHVMTRVGAEVIAIRNPLDHAHWCSNYNPMQCPDILLSEFQLEIIFSLSLDCIMPTKRYSVFSSKQC